MLRSSLLVLSIALFLPPISLHAQETFLGKTADGWVRLLKTSLDVRERRNAAFALGKMGHRVLNELPAIKHALKQEGDAKVRETIVFALGDICREAGGMRQDHELEQLFLNALKDTDYHVRRSAAFALGCLGSGSEAAQKGLDEALADSNSLVRQNAAWAFGKLGRALGKQGAVVLPSLRKGLRDDDSFVKRDAASSLLQIEATEKVHELIKDLAPLCKDPNSEVRRAALNVLVRIVNHGDKDAIPELRSALDDRDLENRRNAALALTNIGGEETAAALPVLLEASRNGDLELRRQAVLGIRNIGPAAAGAVPELMRLLGNDKDKKIRQYAALALGGMGKEAEPAIPLFAEKIRDQRENPETRYDCVMALANVGPVPAAAKVIPILLEVLGNDKQDPRIRKRITWALRKHGKQLEEMPKTLETLVKVLNESPKGTWEHKVLRYECAYTLGMIWQENAPDATLDVLLQLLHDNTVKLFDKTQSDVGGASAETKSGSATVKERSKGDGRVMAADALAAIGANRYAKRPDIMKQLNVLADDDTAYEPLQKKAARLVKAAK